MLEDLHQTVFEPLVHSAFRVSDGAGTSVAVKLVEVAGHSTDPGQECFSLIFTGPSEPLLPQRIYTFEHEEIGAFALFIVPIGQTAAGIRYQAVFNRFNDARAGGSR